MSKYICRLFIDIAIVATAGAFQAGGRGGRGGGRGGGGGGGAGGGGGGQHKPGKGRGN